MRSDELVTAVRLSGGLPSADRDYTDARILVELSNALHTVFERPIVNSRQGYWLKTSTTATVASRAAYRIPARAVVGGLEKLEIAGSDGQYTKLLQVTPNKAIEYEGNSTTTADPPGHYMVQGDAVRLLPAPANANYTLRFSYYIRPSRLVSQQAFTTGSFTRRGRISAVNTTARTLTVDVIPFDQELGTPANITSGTTLIDVVHPDGWFELALVGASQTWSGTTITVGGTLDMSEIAVGDFVRAAQQTDWPCLPEDYHRTLADATAAVVLASKGISSKAQMIGGKVQSDIERLQDLIQPRIKASPRVLRPQYGVIARSARGRSVRGQ